MNITYKRDSIVPAPNDVLFGRGHKIYKHAGNQRYRSVIQSLKREYDAAPKSLRAVYGNQVVNYIQNLQPPGRFLKRQGKGDHAAWIEVDTKSAVERARQALRDKKLPARLPKNSRPSPNHCHDNLLVDGESILLDLNVFCNARNDQTGGRSASSTHSPETSSCSPPPPTIHGGSSSTSKKNISSLVENDEEQGSVSSMVSSLSSSQQNMTGGGVEEENSKEVDEEDLNRLLLNIPLTTKERKITIHQLEEENRILKLKISLLKMEKSVLSTIRKTNSSPDEKLRKASGIPISLKAEAQEQPPPEYYSSSADNDYQIKEGRTIFDIRRNTNRHLTEDLGGDEQQGDLFDSFDLNQFYSSTTDIVEEDSASFLDAREIVEGNKWDEEDDKKEDILIQTLLSSSANSLPIMPSSASRIQQCWGEWQPTQHEPC